MNEKWKNFCYQLANYSGVLYTSVIVGGLTYLCLFHICPNIYGEEECSTHNVYATIILFEIIVNLFCFHYYNKRNQVTVFATSSKLTLHTSDSLLDG